MNVRKRLWWIGPALALLALAGCRPAETPAAGELTREMCEEGLTAAPGGRGQVQASGTCGDEARLVAVNASTTEPMDWMAQQPEFADHYIESVAVTSSPEGGLWRWDEGTYFVDPEKYARYWIEDVRVDVQGDQGQVLAKSMVPISHFACTGLPAHVGTMDCEASVEAKSSQEQVSAGSWGFRVEGKAGTPKWIPLAEGEAGLEFAMQFKHAMKTTSVIHALNQMDLPLMPEQTGYIFVVNKWERKRTPTMVTGRLCHHNRDGGKSCTNGYQEQATVVTLKHDGPMTYTGPEPEPAEHKVDTGSTHPFSWSPAAREIRPVRLTHTVAYGKQSSATTEGRGRLFAEGRLGPVELKGDVSKEQSSQDTQEIEVQYSYTIAVTRTNEWSRDIDVYIGRSGLKSGATVTEGPWFAFCAPTEDGGCK